MSSKYSLLGFGVLAVGALGVLNQACSSASSQDDDAMAGSKGEGAGGRGIGGAGLSSGGAGDQSGGTGTSLGGMGGQAQTASAFSIGWQLMDLRDSDAYVIAGMRFGLNTETHSWNGGLKEGRVIIPGTNAFTSIQSLHSLKARAEDSSLYVTGEIDGAWPGNTLTGVRDLFVGKVSETGVVEWAEQFSPRNPSPDSTDTLRRLKILSIDSTGSFIVADVHSTGSPTDNFLIKRDASGREIWSKPIDMTELVETDGSFGEVTFVGTQTGVSFAWANLQLALPDSNGIRYFWALSRIDADGEVTWTKLYFDPCLDDGTTTTGSSVFALGATSDASGLVALGTCLTRLDGDGELLWSENLAEHAARGSALTLPVESFGIVVQEDLQRFYTVTPNKRAVYAPSVLRSYSGEGALLWQKTYDAEAIDFRLDPAENFLAFQLRETQAEPQRVLQVDANDGDSIQSHW